MGEKKNKTIQDFLKMWVNPKLTSLSRRSLRANCKDSQQPSHHLMEFTMLVSTIKVAAYLFWIKVLSMRRNLERCHAKPR